MRSALLTAFGGVTMREDGACDWHRFIDPIGVKCLEDGKWASNKGHSLAKQFAWCEEHKHHDDERLTEGQRTTVVRYVQEGLLGPPHGHPDMAWGPGTGTRGGEEVEICLPPEVPSPPWGCGTTFVWRLAPSASAQPGSCVCEHAIELD